MPLVTLAVLPFRSIPAESDLLELGLADVFISRLGQLADVRVLPLTATEQLRHDVDQNVAARRLGATHVLSGRLQRENGFVRATVQLISTSDNRTIWSAPVDTDASTLFAIQDIVVTRVLSELAPEITPGARRTLAQAGTRSNDAYEAYVRGRAHTAKPTRAELTRAAALFERAVTLDPAYADAWAALGTVYRMFPLFDGVPGEEFPKAKRAAARALDLDPGHAEAHSVLGTVAFWYDWDYREAERLLRRAVELQPSSTQSYLSLAHLLSNIGRQDEALVEIRRARTLDQEWPLLRSLEGQFLFMARRDEDSLTRLTEVIALEPRLTAGHIMRAYPLIALKRYEDAIHSCDQALALNRNPASPAKPHSFAVALRGYALARLGRVPEAQSVLAQLRAQAREQYVPPHHEALLLHALGRDGDALARLREAVDTRDLFVTFVGVDSKWDGLRDVPAFRALMARASLLEVSDQARR
jgi:TolB-like protein/tetratricopeptide (TPR) repeat protein